MKKSTFKFCGGFSLQSKKHRSLFGASHNLVHGLDPLSLPQCSTSQLLVCGLLDDLQDTIFVIHVSII